MLDEHDDPLSMDAERSNTLLAEPLPISGFTPINQVEDSLGAGVTSLQSDDLIDKIPDGKPKASKRQKMTSSSASPTSKSWKAAGSQKTKRNRTAGELQSPDISTNLSRKKPRSAGHTIEVAVTVSPANITLQEPRPDAELLHDARKAFDSQNKFDYVLRQDRSLGLSDSYQAAYSKTKKIGINSATLTDQVLANTGLPKFHDEEGICDIGSGMDSPSTDNAIYNHHNGYGKVNDALFPDFVPPPSAQREKAPEEARFFPTPAPFEHLELAKAPEEGLETDNIFADLVDADGFPVWDEGLEEVMQSLVPPAEHNEPENDWRPQAYSSDDFIMGNQSCDHDLLHLPVALPYSGTMMKSAANSTTPKGYPLSCVLTRASGNASKPKPASTQILEGSENCFDDDDLDAELIDLTVNGSDPAMHSSSALTSPEKPRTPKLQWMPPKIYTPFQSSQVPRPPMNLPNLVAFNKDGEALPFMRPPFPKPARDRSPILGLTNRTVLRTCFRIGEALNAAAVASRTNADAIIELYARIATSEREANSGYKQIIQFEDLFTDKAPYLYATYSLWKGVGLWDVDSKVFLGENGRGKMARAIGRIKKCEKEGGCEMVVLSIWEVDWEDVGVAKGIVCS